MAKKKRRNITPETRAAWRASGLAHVGNLIRRPTLKPEIEVKVQALVDELTAAHEVSCETMALIESARVSFRAVLVASSRPTSAYMRHRGLLAALTAHQSNLARVLKDLRHMRKIEGSLTPSIGDLLAPFRTPKDTNEPESNAVPAEQ